MTVSAAAGTASGTYSITVTGSGPATRSTTYSLVVGSGTGTWAAGTVYRAGDTVTYAGLGYVCLQGHQAQTGWEPPIVPALWQRV